MQLGGGTPKQVAIDTFVAVLEDDRIAVALGYGSALAAVREVSRATAALNMSTTARQALRATATVADHVAAELEVERWRQYVAVHSAVAREGSLIAFNSIDLALKRYARTRYGPTDTRWLTGGPSYGPTPRSLLEIVRALCNQFRHRDEWLSAQGAPRPTRSENVLRDLGVNPLSNGAYLAVMNLLPFDTWLDFESTLVSAIVAIP
jgi:hypothetical protein